MNANTLPTVLSQTMSPEPDSTDRVGGHRVVFALDRFGLHRVVTITVRRVDVPYARRLLLRRLHPQNEVDEGEWRPVIRRCPETLQASRSSELSTGSGVYIEVTLPSVRSWSQASCPWVGVGEWGCGRRRGEVKVFLLREIVISPFLRQRLDFNIGAPNVTGQGQAH